MAVTLRWDMVHNHPDHGELEKAIRSALASRAGAWVVTVTPASKGWHLHIKGTGSAVATTVPAPLSSVALQSTLLALLTDGEMR